MTTQKAARRKLLVELDRIEATLVTRMRNTSYPTERTILCRLTERVAGIARAYEQLR